MRRTALFTLVEALLLTATLGQETVQAQALAPAQPVSLPPARNEVRTGPAPTALPRQALPPAQAGVMPQVAQPRPVAGQPAPSVAAPAPLVPAAGASGEVAAPAAAPAEPESPELRRAREMRTGSTELGAAGGIYVLDPAVPAGKTLRIQALGTFFSKKDYLYNNDKERFGQTALSLAYVPYQHIELTAATTTRVAKNDKASPEVLHSVGNLHFGVKAGAELTPGVALGGDLLGSFLNGPGDAGIDFKGSSFGLRSNLGLDLRKLTTRQVPLLLRLNVGYLFDNSAKMARDLERKRFDNLLVNGVTGVTDSNEEYRHLVRRDERLALGISRVDVARVALGLEAPLELSERVALHPIAEWQLDIPVNRQGFDCPFVPAPTGGKLGGTDSCLADSGLAAWHQHLTLGARLYPYAGLSFLAGVDIALGGAAEFVQELAPNTPYRLLLGASYNADFAPIPQQVVVVREIQVPVPVPVAEPVAVEPEKAMGRVHGTVRDDADQSLVVAGALVTFQDSRLNALITRSDGTFDTFPFEPGEVRLAVSAGGFEPGQCTGVIPAEGGDINISCLLHALPKTGALSAQVLDGAGAPVGAINVVLTGPDTRSLLTDSSGRVHVEGLRPGIYRARIEHPEYLVTVSQVQVLPRGETSANLVLRRKPPFDRAKILVTNERIKLADPVLFTSGTPQVDERSKAMLMEAADAILRHPEIVHLEVQGHTDDRGNAGANEDLSQARAEAVRAVLIQFGVEAERLVAKGYGSSKPLTPNLNDEARAKNRRVELVLGRGIR